MSTTRRTWIRRAAALGLGGLAIQQAWRHGHDYVLPVQFAVVEPGKIYRGAWQKPWPMRRLIDQYQFKTIIALAHPSHHALVQSEKAIAAEKNVAWIHVPIVDQRGVGNVTGIFDPLEHAANLIADHANQPVYFHCHHGINRASMVQIAYRTLHCDWTLEAATEEISRTFGLVSVNHGPDYRIMVDFYRERVLPRQLARGTGAIKAG